MTRLQFARTWFCVVAGCVAAFGLVFAFANGTTLFSSMNGQIDPVFWSNSGPDAAALAFRGWIYGVLGATMIGWGTTMLFVGLYGFPKRERWVRDAVAVSLPAWYVVDTYISFAARVYFNVLFNTVILLLVMVPVAVAWSEFGEQGERGPVRR